MTGNDYDSQVFHNEFKGLLTLHDADSEYMDNVDAVKALIEDKYGGPKELLVENIALHSVIDTWKESPRVIRPTYLYKLAPLHVPPNRLQARSESPQH